MRQPFVDIAEAWFLAVPVTTYYRGLDTRGVNRIVLRITDERRGQVAVFRCLLRKAPPTTENWTAATSVKDARTMCRASVLQTNA